MLQRKAHSLTDIPLSSIEDCPLPPGPWHFQTPPARAELTSIHKEVTQKAWHGTPVVRHGTPGGDGNQPAFVRPPPNPKPQRRATPAFPKNAWQCCAPPMGNTSGAGPSGGGHPPNFSVILMTDSGPCQRSDAAIVLSATDSPLYSA